MEHVNHSWWLCFQTESSLLTLLDSALVLPRVYNRVLLSPTHPKLWSLSTTYWPIGLAMPTITTVGWLPCFSAWKPSSPAPCRHLDILSVDCLLSRRMGSLGGGISSRLQTGRITSAYSTPPSRSRLTVLLCRAVPSGPPRVFLFLLKLLSSASCPGSTVHRHNVLESISPWYYVITAILMRLCNC